MVIAAKSGHYRPSLAMLKGAVRDLYGTSPRLVDACQVNVFRLSDSQPAGVAAKAFLTDPAYLQQYKADRFATQPG